MIVRRTSLASEVCIGIVAHIAPHVHAGATRFAHAGHQHLLHIECRAIGYSFLLFRRSDINLVAIAVEDTGHENSLVTASVVSDGSIGIDEFLQIDVTGTKGERGRIVERTLDTHLVGRLDNAVDTHFLTHAYSNGIDTLGKGRLESHVIVGEITIGISGAPQHLFLLFFVPDLHTEEGIHTAITGGQSLVHGLSIDKELEGRARLTHGSHLVIFPRLEVEVAHPSLHVTRLWLDGHEAAVHEVLHIADRVKRTHLGLVGAFIAEQLNGVGQVQIIVDRVLITLEALLKVLIDRQTLGYVFDEVGNLLMTLVLPGVDASPVVIELLLQFLHLVPGCLFGILLHARINSGVDLQTIRIEVVAVFVAPFAQIVLYGLAEIGGLTIIGILDAIVEVDGHHFERVVGLLIDVSTTQHITQHYVAAIEAVLGMDARVVISGGLQHAHEDSSLVGSQVLGCGAEVSLAGCLDAEGVRTEVHGVGIHRQDLLFAEIHFQFGGRNPLLGLHDEHLDAGDVSKYASGIFRANAEEVLGELLSDGRCTTSIMVNHIVLQGSTEGLEVNTEMMIESLVLGVDECFPEDGVHIFELYRGAVLAEEFSNHHAVGTIDL